MQVRIKWAGTGANEKPAMMGEFGPTLDVLVLLHDVFRLTIDRASYCR